MYKPITIQRSQESTLSEPGSPTYYDSSIEVPDTSEDTHKPIKLMDHEPLNEVGIDESYEMLLKQLYNLPIQSTIQFIDFQRVTQMLNNQEITNYILDPIYQPWAGSLIEPLPNVPVNRIITLYHINGRKYMVKAMYNPHSGRIYPLI